MAKPKGKIATISVGVTGIGVTGMGAAEDTAIKVAQGRMS